ncbi:MAG: hypothetical protein ACRDJL_12750 [Actinomycetota bacterium]
MEKQSRDRHFGTPFRTLAALSFVVLMLLVQAPGAQARKAPKQTGPLNFDVRRCGGETVRTRIKGRMEVVAKTKTCVLLYTYDPLREDNQDRDYGLVWVQARVDPRGAWCAKRVWSDLGVDVSKDTRVHRRTPVKNLKLRRARRIRVKLATTANGAGDQKATLGERTTFYPRRLQHSTFVFQKSRIVRQRWAGQRGKVLNFTSGAEMSWDSEAEGPDAISSGLLYDFERRGRC